MATLRISEAIPVWFASGLLKADQTWQHNRRSGRRTRSGAPDALLICQHNLLVRKPVLRIQEKSNATNAECRFISHCFTIMRQATVRQVAFVQTRKESTKPWQLELDRE